MLKLDDYPQLKLIAWNRHDDLISEEDAMALYERYARFLDQEAMSEQERALLVHLNKEYRGGIDDL